MSKKAKYCTNKPKSIGVEIFGGSKRFQESFNKRSFPSFLRYSVSNYWENRIQNYEPKSWKSIGNVQSLYHGTSRHALEYIAVQSLLPGSGPFGNLFGNGIYLASNASKAFAHAKEYRGPKGESYRYLLVVRAALGRQYIPKTSGCKRHKLKELGYDSVHALAKTPITGTFNGVLVHSETVVYNPEQVVVDFVVEYRTENAHKPKPIWRTKEYRRKLFGLYADTELNTDIQHHKCKKDGKTCKYAYSLSGCIRKNKKKGISLEDFEFCTLFEPARPGVL